MVRHDVDVVLSRGGSDTEVGYVLVASTRYSPLRRVHLAGRGWAVCEFSKDITSVLSGSIGRQARWSESQQSRRRGWRPRGGLDEGRGSGKLVASARLFHQSSLANTNTVLAKSPIRFPGLAVFLFMYITSKRSFTFPPHRNPIFSPLRLLSVPSSELAGTRLHSPASSPGLPPLANSLSLSSSRPRRRTSPPFRTHSCLMRHWRGPVGPQLAPICFK